MSSPTARECRFADDLICVYTRIVLRAGDLDLHTAAVSFAANLLYEEFIA